MILNSVLHYQNCHNNFHDILKVWFRESYSGLNSSKVMNDWQMNQNASFTAWYCPLLASLSIWGRMECLERINSIDHDTKATGKIEACNECKTTTTNHRRGKLLCLCVFRRGCFELFCSLKKLKVWPPNGVAGMRSRRTEGGDRCDTLRFSTNKPASALTQLCTSCTVQPRRIAWKCWH